MSTVIRFRHPPLQSYGATRGYSAINRPPLQWFLFEKLVEVGVAPGGGVLR